MLLRDPMERTVSQVFHAKRNGYEPLELEEALSAEAHRLASSDPFRLQKSFVARSRYLEQLDRYEALFPAQQLLVLKSGLIPGHLLSMGASSTHLEASTDQTFNGLAARQCWLRRSRCCTGCGTAGAQTSSISHSFRREKPLRNRLGRELIQSWLRHRSNSMAMRSHAAAMDAHSCSEL